MANKRETTLQELMNVTKESAEAITNLVNYGVSKNILTKTDRQSEPHYTLTKHGEETLAFMSSKIIEGWNAINKAVETKDIDTFVKLVKENEKWIQYLRYGKMISAEDADFIIESYEKIMKSRQKKNTQDPEITRMQTDAQIERTRVLTEQQWRFDDENYEITRDYNNYVDTNYDDNY
jgi:hypothetical protein